MMEPTWCGIVFGDLLNREINLLTDIVTGIESALVMCLRISFHTDSLRAQKTVWSVGV